MFEYNYRIRDRYKAEVISLALLTDSSETYRPGQYQLKRWGFEHTFRFPAIKLLDYNRDWDGLENSPNPFAIVVMAHLKAQQGKLGKVRLKDWKLQLARLLFSRNYSKEDVLRLLMFIDWAIQLPPEEELIFRDELASIKEVDKVPYITTFERAGIEKGIEQGLERGLEQGLEKGIVQGLEKGKREGKEEEAAALVLRQLKRRAGEIRAEVESQLRALPLEKLEELGEALLDFTGAADLALWLERNQPA